VRDLALPDVDVHQVRAVRVRQLRRVRQIRLREIVDRRGSLELREVRVPRVRRRAVVLCEQPVDVDASGRDLQCTADGLDQEAVRRRLARHDGLAVRVERTDLDAAPELRDPLVPIGVELDASLLHDDAEEVLPRLEPDAT
jgi:hypothetical protein